MGKTIKGLSASPGTAIGPAWFFEPVALSFTRVTEADPTLELERLQTALNKSKAQLTALVQKTLTEVGAEEAEIFEAHSMFLDDPELLVVIKEVIGAKVNAESAVQDGVESFAQSLLALESEYFQARAADVRDVGRRITANLLGVDLDARSMPDHGVVIFADDLNPSDTMGFEKDKILGFCTRRGGPTSHTAILARSLGVPAVVSAPFEQDWLEADLQVILFGDVGQVVLAPEQEMLLAAQESQKQEAAAWKTNLAEAGKPAITVDGHQVEVVANVGNLVDAQQAVEYGAEGIGLLRTEFLYLDRETMPDLEEQTQSYREIFEVMGKRPIVVRTLDIGGDKQVPYLGLETEPNPFLGWRAIRMMSERPEVLHDQFCALLLAAGKQTDLRIMLPLVSNLDEVIAARNIYNEAVASLEKSGTKINAVVQFGIMVEVPSAALLIDQIAPYVDFYSIGTNDLAQYTLAVDRTNERVASLASPFHPAVIRLIAMTIERAHANKKWVGLCGEMAGNELAAPLLLGLGLDEFSMAPVSIPTIKNQIRSLDRAECQQVAAHVLSLPTTKAVLAYLQQV